MIISCRVRREITYHAAGLSFVLVSPLAADTASFGGHIDRSID